VSQENLTRPEWDLWFLRLAYVYAQRGSCRRKRVGAIIVDDQHRVISAGYNGAPSGMPDCLEAGCDVRMIDGRESCVRTLHAESNALDYVGRGALDAIMYTTIIPCRLCALRIVQAGIRTVRFHEYYESQGSKETAEVLKSGGVALEHYVAPLWLVDSFGYHETPHVRP